jgi:hypothetical protein
MTRAVRLTLLSLVLLFPISAFAQNYVQNSRFMIKRSDATAPQCCPVAVPTAGLWWPEAWRIAPGAGNTMEARLVRGPSAAGQGRALYLRWSQGQWIPCLSLTDWLARRCPPGSEYGAGFLEHYIFEYDTLATKLLRLTFWARVDGCCVGLVLQMQQHYHNGDDEFVQPAPVTVNEHWQHFEVFVQLPPGTRHVTDWSRYIAIVPTFTGPSAPGLYLAHIEMSVF